MATVTKTGPSVGSGFRMARLRLQLDRTDYSSTSTVRFRVWVETSNAEQWTISLTTWGGWSNTGNRASRIDHFGSFGWSTAKRTLVYDHTRSIERYYGGSQTISGSAQVTGIGAGQSPVSATGNNGISITVPARPILAPNAPTGASRSRSSDTRHTVSWSATFSGARPLSRFRIQRHDGLRNSTWRTVTTVASSSRSWTDTSTIYNTRYRWRIRAENDAGSSAWDYTSFISTTPPIARTPTVRHQGGDNLVTVNRGGTNFNVRCTVQHQSAAVGGSWSGWSTIHTTSSITAKNGTVTVRHVDVDNTRRHRYRTRYENVTDSPTLQGPWSDASSIIELLAQPNAPTGLSPNGQTLDSAAGWNARWTHNSVDGTEQTRVEFRSRISGGEWVNATRNQSSELWDGLFASRLEGGSYTEWQVRTWGEFPDPSPWSAIATVYGSEKPQATITEPEDGAVLAGSSVAAAWEFFDPESTTQAQWEATLYDGFDAPMEFRSGSGPTYAAAFLEQLDDDTTYQVGVRVRDGDRLWSDEVRTTFSTEFALPPAPTFSAFFDPESGAVVLDIGVPAPTEGEVEADHVQVWRGIDAEREVLIGERLALGASFTDYLPHLVKPNYYRVVSVSTLPSVRSSVSTPVQVEKHQRQGWVYFNAGTGFERVVRVRADAEVQVTQGREKAMRTFAGRSRPVEFSGEHETWGGSLSVKLAPSEPGHATRDDLARIVQLPAPICYRDITAPSGMRVFVSLGDFDHSQRGVVSNGSLPFTRVEDPEIKHTDAALATGQLPGSGDSGEGE